MNIGELNFGRAGKMPQTVNVGIAVNPTITMFRSLIVGLDSIDVLNDYKQDTDMAKRLRYGAELQLFDIWPVELALRAGMYESYPTFGADLRLLFITASYVMYTEEVGAYAGQDKDKRQLLTLNIGWYNAVLLNRKRRTLMGAPFGFNLHFERRATSRTPG
jgi:hypothetical protein